VTAREARLGTLTTGGALALSITDGATAHVVRVGGRLTAATGTLAVRDLGVTGDATLTSGGVTLGTAKIGGSTALDVRERASVESLEVGGSLAAKAGVVVLGTATVRGPDATVTAREARLGTLTTGGALALSITEAATADVVRVDGRLSATTGTLGVRDLGVTGDATLTSGGPTLGTAKIGGSAALDVRDRATAETWDVGGPLTAKAGALALRSTTVRGGDGTLDAGSVELGQLSTSGAARITARGALTADRLEAGSSITASSQSARIGQATAGSGDLALTATDGDLELGAANAGGTVGLVGSAAVSVTGAVRAGGSYRVEGASITFGTAGTTAQQEGAEVAMTARSGAITGRGSTTIAATRSVTMTAKGASGAISLAPETAITASGGDVTLATTGAAALGAVTAAAGAIRLDAADATLTRAITARAVTLANVATAGVTRLGETATDNSAEFDAPATRFDLSSTELGLISAPAVTIVSGARDVVVGAVALAAGTGSERFAISATGRVDMLGRFVASGATAARTIAIGSQTATGRTGVIRIAATQANGGRVLVDGATLELTGERIGVGLDRDFLDAVGYRTEPGLSVAQVTQTYVAGPTSTLYNASGLGAAPYSDRVLVRAGGLKLSYGRYALFQNTGITGEQAGVELGGAGKTGAKLSLGSASGSSNAFAMFGTIDGIRSQATALLGPDRLAVEPTVTPVASRVNGCVIGSGAGCLNTSIAQPSVNLFDASRAEIVRTPTI
jgi:hypothetical protein